MKTRKKILLLVTLVTTLFIATFFGMHENLFAGTCTCLCVKRLGACGAMPPFTMLTDCMGDGTSPAACAASNGCIGQTERHSCDYMY